MSREDSSSELKTSKTGHKGDIVKDQMIMYVKFQNIFSFVCCFEAFCINVNIIHAFFSIHDFKAIKLQSKNDFRNQHVLSMCVSHQISQNLLCQDLFMCHAPRFYPY